VFKGLSSSL